MREKDLWYKRAVIYALDVETFQDADGDGIGDFQGLISRLDYLSTLGITCLWLLPFYPSPNRDNGYDVMDYYNVDSRLGTLGDFAAFIQEAKERGIRVLVDLVVNHTSNRHPWFEEARRNQNSVFRDYYVWRKEKPTERHAEPIFKGIHDDIWAYDEVADAYFLHRFFDHQPDLNIANPAVHKEIHHIMGFWLALGVAGFRVDAAHVLVQNNEDAAHEGFYDLLEDMRAYITTHSRDAILLAEATGTPETVGKFFKGTERMHMMFNFLLNQHIFLGLASEQGSPIAKGLRLLPEKDPSSQWLNFLRHHDELNLEDLAPEEQEVVFGAFAPEKDMRIFERGIRRRLAPMLGGNRAKIELAYSLLFSMPGTPMIQYGAEIGMGDDLSLPERNSVRTPMQWSNEQNAGFSNARNQDLIRPVISTGAYAYPEVNVARQQRQTDSLLNWMEHMIRVRRQCPEIGDGICSLIETGHSQVMAHSCSLQHSLVAVHNLSSKACQVCIEDLLDEDLHLIEVFSNTAYDVPQQGQVDLSPYGYRWFRLKSAANAKRQRRAEKKRQTQADT